MARIKIGEIIEELERDLRRALSVAVKTTMPEAVFDENKLFREFTREVKAKCNPWEKVSDRYVESDR